MSPTAVPILSKRDLYAKRRKGRLQSWLLDFDNGIGHGRRLYLFSKVIE